MNFLVPCMLLASIGLASCSVETYVRKNDARYGVPGAMDSPLTGVYNAYEFQLLDRYRISHDWFQSGCRYRGVEHPPRDARRAGSLYIGRDIVEKDGKTWLNFADHGLFDFDPWVRSVPHVSQDRSSKGVIIEVGLKPVCYETWWGSGHFLRLRLYAGSLAKFEASFSRTNPGGVWRSEAFNGLDWRVQQTPREHMITRQPTGVGGPYQSWLVAVGDTGYTLSLEMGANRESLDNVRMQAAVEAAFLHLLRSIRIERLPG